MSLHFVRSKSIWPIILWTILFSGSFLNGEFIFGLVGWSWVGWVFVVVLPYHVFFLCDHSFLCLSFAVASTQPPGRPTTQVQNQVLDWGQLQEQSDGAVFDLVTEPNRSCCWACSTSSCPLQGLSFIKSQLQGKIRAVLTSFHGQGRPI